MTEDGTAAGTPDDGSAGDRPPTPPPPPPASTPPPPPPPASTPPPPPPPPLNPAGAATPMYPGSGGPDIGAAFSWAFAKFGQNWAVLVSMAAILVVIRILDWLLNSILDGGVDDCSGNLTQQQAAECVARVGGFALGTLIVTLVMALVSAVVIVGIIQASLKLTRGETPEFSDLWTPTNFWQYILVTIVFWICMFFGIIACILPGLFVAWIWQFSQYVALDTGPGVGASLGQSYRMVMANKGVAVLTLLIFGIAWTVSYWSFGLVGLFTIPFMGLFMSHMYRQFNHQPVAS